jgi:Uma2 family endonuclease
VDNARRRRRAAIMIGRHVQQEEHGSVTPLPRSRPLIRADLDTMPDDGHRYELIDGVLVVTPAPSPLHQIVAANLFALLRAACPSDLRVLFAPLDVAISYDTVMQPDLQVARRADFTARDVPVAPLLAVEILSKSTERVDRMLKRSRFESAGAPSFWLVDPRGPALEAWELRDGRYAQVARVAGDETFRASRPFEVTVTPADLIL